MIVATLRSLAESAVRNASYPGLAGIMVLETVFPPIPSELVLPLAGFQVQRGQMLFVGALIAATLGALAGSVLLYALARSGGRAAILRFGRVLRVTVRDLDRAERWFERYGTRVVFFGRMVPGARSLVSIPAGVAEMPLVRFCVVTAAGSAIWNAALLAAGMLLGRNWRRVEELLGPIATVVVGAILLGAVVAAVRWRRRRGEPVRR